ncbi:MAG: TonB-dependent receptor [Vicinamibacteria bacterium]
MLRPRMTAFVLAFCVFVAASAMAQYGQFEGTVRDPSGAVLPGATVTVTNQETGLTRTAVTSGDGFYRLPGLSPGLYSIRCELPSFATQTLTDIILTIQQTVIQHFTMDVAQIEETITVTGESPLVDMRRSDVTTSISELQIQDLPVGSRRWVDLAMLTPGVSQDNIRGFYYRGNANIGAGTREYSNAFIVDGVNNTWAEMGEARQNFPMDAIGEFKVTTSNFKAEYGLATGGVMTVVSKSGTNDLAGSAFLYLRDEALNSKTFFEQEKPDYKRYQYGGAVGGPIVKDKTHFFFAYERTDEDVFYTVNTRGVFPEVDGTFPSEQWRYMWITKLDHRISDKQNIWARIAWENEYRPNLTAGGITAEGFDFAVPRDSEVVGHTWVASDRIMNEFRFQRAFSKYEVSPAFSHGSFDAGDFSAERLALCDVEIFRPTLRTGSCNDQMGPETRWQFKNDLTYFNPNWGGDHQFKMGADYNYIEFQADILNQYNGRFTFATDAPFDANVPGTYPVQYIQSQPQFADRPVHHFSVYFQDDWSPTSNLTLNLGLRYDLQAGPFNEDILDIDFPLDIPFHEGADQRGDFNNFGPRIGFAWDPTETGRTVIKGGYGLFYDNIRTLLSMLGERTWHQAQQIIIANPGYPDPLGGRSREEFVSTAPPNIEVMTNDFENPYAHQYNLGVSRQLSSDFALSVDFTYVRRFADLNTNPTVNINYPVDGVRPYPQFGRVGEDRSTQENRYKGFFVKLDKRFANRYQYLVSYTWSDSEDRQFRNDDLTTTGFVMSDWYQAMADRRHRLVASGIVQLPYDIQFSAIMDLRSALPFEVNTGTDVNRDTYTNDLAPGTAFRSGCRDLNLGAANAYLAAIGAAGVSESIECPGFANVDLRGSKFFNLPGGQRFELIVQALNLLNRANFNVPIGNLRSSSFGQVTDILPNINAPSRQIEVAVRFAF